MFLRFRQDNTVRTIDLNHVIQIYRTEAWGDDDGYTIHLEWTGNYEVVASKLTLEEANELESKIFDAWKRRNYVDILEIA